MLIIVRAYELRCLDVSSNEVFIFCSDQMGNKGAFITMGPDAKPNFTTYDAVVSIFSFVKSWDYFFI